MDDKSLGSLIVAVSVIVMVGYFIWAFGPYIPPLDSWISPAFAEWAYRLPIILAVYMILFIFAWIGYTMATTPPPLPLEGPLEIEEVEVDATDRGGDTEN